jgi:protein TonB
VSAEIELLGLVDSPAEPAESRLSERRRAQAASAVAHLLILIFFWIGSPGSWFGDAEDSPVSVTVRFYEPGGEGEGGGGGGGGSGGRKPTAYIPIQFVKSRPPDPTVPPEPRKAPLAPRKPRPLNFDDLTVPDLPAETSMLFEGIFSPDAVELPGLSPTDGRDLGGLDTEKSAGSGGGIGGGQGTGVGVGTGWGVGEGSGGGAGGGEYKPGSWDIEPVPIFKPPDPPYPSIAREKMVAGEVILQVLVKLDGSTEVVGVLKSLPYCLDAAKENAKLWRWKPALKNGKPVEAFGIITVTFDIFAQKNAKS